MSITYDALFNVGLNNEKIHSLIQKWCEIGYIDRVIIYNIDFLKANNLNRETQNNFTISEKYQFALDSNDYFSLGLSKKQYFDLPFHRKEYSWNGYGSLKMFKSYSCFSFLYKLDRAKEDAIRIEMKLFTEWLAKQLGATDYFITTEYWFDEMCSLNDDNPFDWKYEDIRNANTVRIYEF